MRLTHIKLAGFKSFVDPTTIAVPGKLVAVIGPNGCGKSNVIDAVRWVLGEASAKQLRGESMQDVIFNGAATRRPAPRASVELVFDNSDGKLQGAWGQYAEVSIKRQLTRQGESTYFINNQTVRRRDITDLFLGTGVGARGYAVIEQGMISRIIEARPEELRAYIEEAAGVSKYKERRRETESRLKDTREHLQRLADLQGELDRQVEKLQRQAKTAEQYQKLKAQLSQQQDLLDYVQWQEALRQADAAGERHRSSQAALDTLSEESDTLQAAVEALREQELQQQQAVHEAGNARAVLREQWARLEEQIRHRQQLQQRFEREKNQAQAHLQRLAQQSAQLAAENEDIAAQIEEQNIALEECAWQVAEQESRLPELEEEVQQSDAARQSRAHELSRLQRELALKEQQCAHAERSTAQLHERQQRLQDELAQLALPEESELEAAQAAADEAQAEVETLEEAEAQNEETYAQARAAAEDAQTHCRALEKQETELRAQHAALSALLPSADGNDFWADSAFADAPPVWRQIEVDAPWQQAVGAVLGKRLQARAAEGFAPDTLPESGAAWINRRAAVPPQPHSLAARVHCAHETVQAAVNAWLGHVRCADSLADALARQHELAAHEMWVTPQGCCVDAAGVYADGGDSETRLLQQRRQLRDWENELDALAEPLRQAQEKLAQCRRAVDEAEARRQPLQLRLKEQQHRFQAAAKQATELLAKSRQGQLRGEHIRLETAQAAQELAELAQQRRSAQADAETLREAVSALTAQQGGDDALYQRRQQELKQAQLSLLEAKRAQGMAEMALVRLQQRVQNIAQEQERIAQESLEWQERQNELALNHEQETADHEQQLRLGELNAKMEAAEEACVRAQEQLSALQKNLQNHYAQQQNINSRLPESREAVQQALLQQQEALLTAKRFYDALQEHRADTDALAEILSQQSDTAADVPSLSREIGSLAQRINALGAVNLAALQELEEADGRRRYYAEQTADVQAAIALLEEAIAQIDDETKSRFKTTFDAVNSKVQTYFPTLFGGGEATLQMVGDDLLSAGVAIMARPPGKKNSTIHLLSGGEKALTAMSLVFALFSLNPAPFCLLDEVDAPLDDANTGRFCRLVQEMSAQTQFLYISHNRLTMEMAEQLVGVTMQEKGVSRIVAVDIRQAMEMAESGTA